MGDTGYVIRETYVRLAIERAAPDDLKQLYVCLELVAKLDYLERSFSSRLQDARAHAGIKMPQLSRAASDETSQSLAADHEHHRLLSRRCNRATSANQVVQELLTTAEDELDFGESLAQHVDDEPCRQLHEELLVMKRELVRCLTEFIKQ